MYGMDKYHIVANLSHFQDLPQRSSLKAVSQNSHNDFLSGSGKICYFSIMFYIEINGPLATNNTLYWVSVCSDNIINNCHQYTLEKSQ